MRKFNVIKTRETEVKGSGSYRKTSDGLNIKAEDYNILKFFTKTIREKRIISSISFEGGDSNSAFGGDFLVTNIDGDVVTLKKA